MKTIQLTIICFLITKILICQTNSYKYIKIYPMLGELENGNTVNFNSIIQNPCFILKSENIKSESLQNISSTSISVYPNEIESLEQFRIIRFRFSYIPCINLSNSSISETNCLDNEHISLIKNMKSESKIFFIIEVLNSKTSEIKTIDFTIKLE